MSHGAARREMVFGVLAVLVVASFLVTCTPPAQRPTRSGSTQVVSVAAADAPGGHRQVWIYRPAVPDSASLPVLYFLHGLPGKASDLAGAGMAAQLDGVFSLGAVRPFVLAAPDGNSTGADDPEWGDSVDGRVRLETFVTGDLIGAVEGDQRRDRGHRAIAGFSMGGFGAANIALRHPDLFAQFVSLDGYFHLDDPSGVFGHGPVVQAANSPDQHLAQARKERILLVGGMQDGLALTASEDERFAGLLRAAGIPVTHYTPAGTHSWEFVSSSMPFVELFLDQGWT